MNLSTCSLFSQLLSLVDRSRFARLVRGTGSERRSKGFASWDHFVAMLFCQLAQARSLREIDAGLSSCEGKLKHLGMAGAPGRSTLSYANSKRPAELFERLFHQLLGTVTLHAPGKKFRFKSKLYSLDSTVIELCATMFDWAKFRATKDDAALHNGVGATTFNAAGIHFNNGGFLGHKLWFGTAGIRANYVDGEILTAAQRKSGALLPDAIGERIPHYWGEGSALDRHGMSQFLPPGQ